jgi:hypothetical protein
MAKPNGKKPNGAASKAEAKPKQTSSKTPGKQAADRGDEPKRNAAGRFTGPNATSFKPGQSGNPGGAKPRVSLVDAIHRRLLHAKELAARGIEERDENGDIQRPPTPDELVDNLLAMAMRGNKEALGAVNTLLDRTDGKPTQGIEHTGKDGNPIEVRSARDDILGRLARITSTSEARRDDPEPN